MKTIAPIAIALMLQLPFSAYAEETQMVPIEEFLKGEGSGKDELGDAAKQFVGLRCGSLYLMLSQYGKDNGMADVAERFRSAADVAFELAQSVKPYNEEYALAQVDLIMSGYKRLWLSAKAMTGNFSDDRVIKSDINFCGKVF